MQTSSNSTIVRATTRGYACTNPDADPSNCLSIMATPTVVEVGRQHFNCTTLSGVELENGEGNCGVLGAFTQGVHLCLWDA